MSLSLSVGADAVLALLLVRGSPRAARASGKSPVRSVSVLGAGGGGGCVRVRGVGAWSLRSSGGGSSAGRGALWESDVTLTFTNFFFFLG